MAENLYNTYFVFMNIDSGERHYLFKRNVLRFRFDRTDSDDFDFIQFTMRDGEKVGFFMTKNAAGQFRKELPHPTMANIVNAPKSVS